SHPPALPRSPMRLNLYDSFLTGRIMPKAAPYPIFWLGTHSALHRVPMYIAELFEILRFAVYVEIVIAFLPERLIRAQCQGSRDRLFQRLQRSRQRRHFRFAHQHMNVFRHDDITRHIELVLDASALQRLLKDGPSMGIAQFRLATITAEGEKV